MKRKPESNLLGSFAASAMVGCGVAILFTLMASVIGTWIVNKGGLESRFEAVFTFAVWLISSLIGTFISGRMIQSKLWVAIILTTAEYLLVLLTIKIAFYEGPIIGIGKGIIAIVIGAVASYIMLNVKPRGKKAKTKYHFR